MRQCVGCREMKEKKDMIRIIRTPENEVLMEVNGKTNGRGAYLCFSADCLKKAKRSKALERSLNIVIPEEIYARLEEEMRQVDTAGKSTIESGAGGESRKD